MNLVGLEGQPKVVLRRREPRDLSAASSPRGADESTRTLSGAAPDEDGKRFSVIVWQNKPSLSTVSYSLEDRMPVHYEGQCYFVPPSGRMLTRCEA